MPPYAESITCVVCLGVTWWWWNQKAKSSSNSEHGNGCNNPNCLRCHSSSQRHVSTFLSNVTLLRKLVKLEPDLFAGMRPAVWSTIEDMEREFEYQNITQTGLLYLCTRLIRRCSLWWHKIGIAYSAARAASCSSIPLSPQQGQDPTVFFLPGLEAVPFHVAKQCQDKCPCMHLWKSTPISNKKSAPIPVTGDIEVLHTNYNTIRKELLDYLSNQQSNAFEPFDPNVYTSATGQKNNTQNNKQPEWSSIYLYHQGIRQSDVCSQYFPQTTQILEAKCPHIMAGKCGFGSIYFSKLERNTKVKEHCGPTNIQWRCHLPLIVPKSKSTGEGGSCLCVGLPGVNEMRVGWKEGMPILFDDSFLHSAVHYGNDGEGTGFDSSETDVSGARIVLIIDFWHPSLSESDRTALGVLYPPDS